MTRTAFPLALVALALAGWMVLGPISFDAGRKITVTGTSNLHGWSCESTAFTGTATGTASGSALTALTALSVSVPVNSLDCKNRTMNGKLREALGANVIAYTVTRATVNGAAISLTGRLSVHGQTRPVTVNARAQSLGGGRFRVTGSVPVTMSQYGVRPPTALAGTMRTGDATTVAFDIPITVR
jgi:polyisoprenoid-binding protein YceI